MTADRSTQRIDAAAAVLFIAFAVWGSLFPFEFVAVPWRDAVASFWSPAAIPVARWSISDFVSNVLLFVPIGLFAMAACDDRSAKAFALRPPMNALRRRPLRRAKVSAERSAIPVVVFGSIVLSTAIELGQAFVPWRTPSVVDVGAETLGAICGIAAWLVVGKRLDALVSGAADVVRRSPLGERLLLAYCALFAVAWLVPADFTLRPNEIADKYLHKRLLLPFMPSPDAATASDLTMIGAAALPIGITATLCGCGGAARRSLPSAALVAITFLIGLEAAQIFVFSRVTDGTALLVAGTTAAAAAMLAAVAGGRPIAARPTFGGAQ
jgi:glycopeptide antibiotics resistance protein